MRKIIISLAPVAANTPIDSERLAEDVAKSVSAGASMCHLHCRLPDGSLSADTGFMIQCFEKILEKTDVIVQASTGGVSDLTIEERCLPLNYPRVESASLNAGTTNLGDAVYINTFPDIRYCSEAVYRKNILPEIEVFDIGMIQNIERLAKEIPFRAPLLFNLVFGHRGVMQPTIDSLIAFRSMVPPGAMWGVTHFGRDNWHFLAAAIAMGASVVRIGFEDSAYISPDESADYNYLLVERLVRMIRSMELEPASVREARQLLGGG